MKTLAIIPVYRDNDSIFEVLSKFREKVVDEICVIWDAASKKDMGKILSAAVPIEVHLIRNEERKGIGYAIRQGIQYALDKDFSIVVVLAGNNKDDPREIPRLLEPIIKEDYDYVQGSRFLAGGRCVKNPLLRGIFSRFYPFLWTLLTKVRCTDVTNGFRAYRLSIFEDPRINIWQRWLDDYELEYYIHYKALTLGYKTIEAPVSKTYSHRHKGGYSQISPFRDWWRIVRPLFYLKLGTKQ
ncbi:MAG: glycosyltransferase family 2 protein [Candidatus Bathyarchaeia archaeon]